MQHPEKVAMVSSRPHTSSKPSLSVYIDPPPGISGDNQTGHTVEPKSNLFQPEPEPEQSSWCRKPDPYRRRLPDLEDQPGLPRQPTDSSLGECTDATERRASFCCCSRATMFVVVFFVIVVVAAVVAGGVAGSQAWGSSDEGSAAADKRWWRGSEVEGRGSWSARWV